MANDSTENKNPYGEHPYGNSPYGNSPYGSSPYGSSPYGSSPYGSSPYGSNPYGSNPYGSNPYGSNPYGSGNPYGNPYGQPTQQQNAQQEDDSGFNLLEWVFRIMQHWYLFVLGVIVAFVLSYIQNRKWIPTWVSSGTMIIQEYGSTYGSQALMTGFGVDAGFTNAKNQVLILQSYDLMSRVVDSLPFFNVEYITQGRFKKRNLYNETPTVLDNFEITHPATYGTLFTMDILADGTFDISIDETEFKQSGYFGRWFECPYFKGVFMPTANLRTGRIYLRFRSHEDLVGEFQGKLTLDWIGAAQASVLALTLVSETPQRDCDFINKLVDVYQADNLARKNNVADNSIKFINEQLANLQESLVVSEGAMTNFRQQNKFIDVSSYAGTLMGKMADYDQQEMALNLRQTYLDYLSKYLDDHIEAGTIIAPSSLGLNESMLMTLVQQHNDLCLQRNEVTEKNVYYAKYTKDIQNVEMAIKEVVKSMRASLDIERQDLHARYADVERDIQNLPEKELQMVAIERNYRIDDNYYTFFLQKRAEAEIQKASNMPDNTILDRARTTAITNAGAKRRTTIMYLLFGILIPLVYLIVREIINNSVRTPSEAEKLSKYSLIGSLRHVQSQNPTFVAKRPRSSYAEMLRALRTRIGFAVQKKDKQRILVTSAESGDGKTFLSTNLAALYAMTGRKTLLIDMDIRKPNIHEKLGLDNGNGVTNYLIGDCTLDEVIDTDTPFQFDLIRAGSVPPNPGEVIRSDKVVEMLNILEERYDYIIIDSSPLGLVSDAYALLDITDITLFVVRAHVTNKHFAETVLEQLYADNKQNIYIVLSDLPTASSTKYGSKGYGYGYGYGYGGYGTYGYGYGFGYGYGLYGRYGRRRKKNGYGYGYGSSYGYGSGNNNYYSDDDDDDTESAYGSDNDKKQ
ncbi:MAG: polysaccharide biosynthesis tyrosine autokinase [Paludibacteraceae bacterium]|nr:polysaccharide biosynthesis tyrosine autokinase [Paludibacteraceae bacterium]